MIVENRDATGAANRVVQTTKIPVTHGYFRCSAVSGAKT